MIRISLPDDEVERLDQLLRTTDDVKLRHRARIVLMAHRGRPHPYIARDAATGPRLVQRRLNAYNQGGLDALRPRKARGATPRLAAELAPTLRQWVIDGAAKQGLDRADWTHAELADHLLKTKGIRVKKSAMQASCRKHEIRPSRPTPDSSGATRPSRPRRRSSRRPSKRAGRWWARPAEPGRGEIPDGADDVPDAGGEGASAGRRHPGLQGPAQRLGGGQRRDRRVARQHPGEPANATRKTGKSKARRMREAFAAHLRHVGRVYAKDKHKRAVLIIDNAPWHRGRLIDEALADDPHREFKLLPIYSPQMDVIERFRELPRRRATHNQLFASLADLKRSLRASLCDYQTVRGKIRSLIAKCYDRPQEQDKATSFL